MKAQLAELKALLAVCKNGKKALIKAIKAIKAGKKVRGLAAMIARIKDQIWEGSKIKSSHVVVQHQDKILMLQNRDGEWTLPGGQLDSKERAPQGAARECLEETGLKVRIKGFVAQTLAYARGSKVGRIYTASLAKGRVVIKTTYEHLAHKWASVKEACKSLLPRHAMAVAMA